MNEAEATIQKLHHDATASLKRIATAEELEVWRIEYLGRKGKVPLFLRTIKDLPADERKHIGKLSNDIRVSLEQAYKEKKEALAGSVSFEQSAGKEAGNQEENAPGHLHPLTISIARIEQIFAAMGFAIVGGPEVEEAKYAFDHLNIPLEHPARSLMDTFYIDSGKEHKDALVLRPHTSSVQTRAVLENHLMPPFRILSPGRVFRSENTDATHETTFYQFEGLAVGEGVSIADFKGVVEKFFSLFFGKEVAVRLRPSYFPFVEPGFEVDMSCPFCDAAGCRVCKQSGWVEVMGAGMVHPNVLRNMNMDPESVTGFAFGGAVDRLTMLRHGINDIRLFWSGDIRFLKQFS